MYRRAKNNANISLETMQARGYWSDIFKVLIKQTNKQTNKKPQKTNHYDDLELFKNEVE